MSPYPSSAQPSPLADQNPPSRHLGSWTSGIGDLSAAITNLRIWMNQVSQLGIPHFGELALRLKGLRKRLIEQLSREDVLHAAAREPGVRTGKGGATELPGPSAPQPWRVLDQLDDLIEKLDQLEPPFSSWQSAVDRTEDFIGALEQHETDELHRIQTPSFTRPNPGPAGE